MNAITAKFEQIIVAGHDGVGTITLNNPVLKNAATPAMVREIMAALDAFEAPDSGVRCIVMSGSGNAFCSGGSLRPGDSENTGPADAGYTLEATHNPLILRLRGLTVPFITAVNGAAVGFGASLALMGDLVLAASSSFFLHGFRNVGLIPDGGATWMLPRVIGRARAMEMSLLGERLSAAQAFEWGIVNRVYEDDELIAQVRRVAVSIATGPTRSFAITRRLYWDGAERCFEEQLAAERQAQRAVGATEDYQEGVAAFRQRRAPVFKGR
ncbi:enoyl-CoA hydratase-related protein [Paraburkholderia elongata]|uniref:2-(1,2-epoxy-1,2-dihydrophenyl)acetyl-CoA isomerase n=1 Tax=Paraburkholderia elongata TaxID=2675747 RepID=A0A972SKR3_9BURK|nr:enoyl-CoA hydratase-related protein [Paraburkholderia elongata]NPT54870.1 2-(1,2-epoxy-1,2-dihydrophenyl)acetyl-CoA isomerase [Paraburkholderia elongata]